MFKQRRGRTEKKDKQKKKKKKKKKTHRKKMADLKYISNDIKYKWPKYN